MSLHPKRGEVEAIRTGIFPLDEGSAAALRDAIEAVGDPPEAGPEPAMASGVLDRASLGTDLLAVTLE